MEFFLILIVCIILEQPGSLNLSFSPSGVLPSGGSGTGPDRRAAAGNAAFTNGGRRDMLLQNKKRTTS